MDAAIRAVVGGAAFAEAADRGRTVTVDTLRELLADPPKTVNLREDVMLRRLNASRGGMFSRENRDSTVAELRASQEGDGIDHYELARKRLADAEARLKKHMQAIEASKPTCRRARATRTRSSTP